MNLIERYIFRRTLSFTLMTLATITVIVMITQVLIRVNLLTDSGQAISTFLALALMLVPAMVLVVAPFALLIGASQTLSNMNNDSELAVIEAAGGSQMIVARPIVIIAVGLSLVCLLMSVLVAPWSSRQIRDIVSGAGADLVRTAVQSGSFKQLDDNLFIQIAEELPGGAFGGIFIADLRDSSAELLYYAKRGAIQQQDDTELLLMADGEIHRKNASSGEVSIIRFASYAIDFSQFGAAAKATIYFPKERTTAYLFDPDPNDTFTKRRPDMIRSEIHRRFSEWMFPLTFGVIAIYFAGTARANRQERIWSLAAAGLVALAFRTAGFIATEGSGSSTASAVMSYVAPVGSVVLFSWLILTERQLRIPQRFVDGVSAAAAAFERRRISLQLWLRGYRGMRPEAGA